MRPGEYLVVRRRRRRATLTGWPPFEDPNRGVPPGVPVKAASNGVPAGAVPVARILGR